MATIGDAVGAGLISSLARPGGNVTGPTLVATEQGPKRLELIKKLCQIFPTRLYFSTQTMAATVCN